MTKYESETERIGALLKQSERDNVAAADKATRQKGLDDRAAFKLTERGVVYAKAPDAKVEAMLTLPLARRLHGGWGEGTAAGLASMGIGAQDVNGRTCYPLLSLAAAFTTGALGQNKSARIRVAFVREPHDLRPVPNGAGWKLDPDTVMGWQRLLREPMVERFRYARGELRMQAKPGVPAWELSFSAQQYAWALASLDDGGVPAETIEGAFPFVAVLDGGRLIALAKLTE